ncbi:hypothetical protein D3C76_944400 [compost metagenome]
MDHLNRFNSHLSTILFGSTEQFHVADQTTRANAHDKAAAAEMVELSDISSYCCRVVLRQIQHACGELNVLGGVQERGEKLEWVRDRLRAAAVVFAYPYLGVAQLISQNCCLAILLQHFSVVTPRIVQRHHEKTEFHMYS